MPDRALFHCTFAMLQAGRGGSIFGDSNALINLRNVEQTRNSADDTASNNVGCNGCRLNTNGGSTTTLNNAEGIAAIGGASALPHLAIACIANHCSCCWAQFLSDWSWVSSSPLEAGMHWRHKPLDVLAFCSGHPAVRPLHLYCTACCSVRH